MDPEEPAINWLLTSGDPSIRYLTLTELLDEPSESRAIRVARRQIPSGPVVKALLAGQRRDGGFGVHPYQKWSGAHWRLVSLVELGIPAGFQPAVRAANQVLEWLTGKAHVGGIKKVNGLTRRCASQEGNALAVCSRLGLTKDPRVVQLADSLVDWQWPDGGWNCDKRPQAHHSSFNESLSTLLGLVEYQRATGDKRYSSSIGRASELFLAHNLFRSHKTGQIINPELLKLHYPLYWHYDILQALMILSRAGRLNDPRTKEALDIVEGKRGPDSLWRAEGYYWRRGGRVRKKGKTSMLIPNSEVVDWRREGPNRMITLNALRVLKAAGRIK
jgi:hypothetical protein